MAPPKSEVPGKPRTRRRGGDGGACAYRRGHDHYGWPLIAARIGALYAELLAAHPRAARA